MYEAFFEMTNTPFVKNIPVSSLYIPPFIEEAQGRLTYGVDNNLFIVVTGDPGCGKTEDGGHHETRIVPAVVQIGQMEKPRIDRVFRFAAVKKSAAFGKRFGFYCQ